MIEEVKKRIDDAKLVYEKLKTNLESQKQIYYDIPAITLSEAREKIYNEKRYLEQIIEDIRTSEEEQKWLDDKEF